MADEQQLQIGSVSVAGNEETLEVLRAMQDSIARLRDDMSKTSESSGEMDEYIKSMTLNNIQLVSSLMAYSNIIQSVNSTAQAWAEQIKAVAESHSKITKEGEAQLSIEEKRRQQHAQELQKTTKGITGAIHDPVSAGINFLGPEAAAIAAVTSAAVKAIYEPIHELSNIAVKGGESTIGGAFGTVGNIGRFGMESKINSMLGYATEAESQATVSTLMKLGGFRGDDLINAFDGITSAARDAGMALAEYSAAMATVARRFEGQVMNRDDGSVSAPDIIKHITKIAGIIAERENWNKEALEKSLLQVTGELAPYVKSGETDATLETTLTKVVAAQYRGQPAINEGYITQEYFNKMLIDGAKQGNSLNYTLGVFDDMLISAKEQGTSVMAIDKQRVAISDQIIAVSKDRTHADFFAMEAVTDFAKAAEEGKAKMATLSAVMTDLHSKTGLSGEEIAKIAMEFDEAGGAITYSGTTLAKNAVDLANRFQELGGTYSDNFTDAKEIVKEFGTALRDGKINISDLSKVILESETGFGLIRPESEELARTFIRLHDHTGVATTKLVSWSESFAKEMRVMFDDPKEALAMSVEVMDEFAQRMEKGILTSGDITKIMKIQMDVFGNSADTARDKVDGFAEMVENSGIRMEEFTAFLSSSTQTMRRFGIAESEGTALFMGMNQYLRDMTISAQGFNDMLKGPLGANEGMRAMLFEQAQGAGGTTGRLAQAAGNVYGFDVLIGELQQAGQRGTGDIDPRLQAMGITSRGAARRALREFESGMTGLLGGMSEEVGGTPGTFGAEGLELRLAEATGFGGIQSATGRAARLATENIFRGARPPVETRPDAMVDFNSLSKKYDKFGDHVSQFGAAISTFVQRVENPPPPPPEPKRGKVK